MAEVQSFLASSPKLQIESGSETSDFDDRSSTASVGLDDFPESAVFYDKASSVNIPVTAELEAFRAEALLQLDRQSWFSRKSLKRCRSTSPLPVVKEKRLKKEWVPSPTVQREPSAEINSFVWPVLPTQSLSFVDLPSEIRQQIYRILFVRSSVRPVCQEPRYFENQTSRCPAKLAPYIPFLRTNSSIYREASSVLYRENIFNVYGLDNGVLAFNFVQAIGEQNRRAIRYLDFDWHHGFSRIRKSQQSIGLFAKINDETNPLREDLAKAAHAIMKENCQRYADSIALFRQPVDGPLRRLTVNFPSQDADAHPQNLCHKVGCSGCENLIKEVLWDVKGLDSVTLGESEWKSEVETMARIMQAKIVNVTNIECLELTEETKQELEKQGWKAKIVWESEEDEEEYRKMLTKVLRTPSP